MKSIWLICAAVNSCMFVSSSILFGIGASTRRLDITFLNLIFMAFFAITFAFSIESYFKERNMDGS